MTITSRIGMFDSGIGGLSILAPLLKLPFEEIIYYADTKHMPYGNKTPDEIRARCYEITSILTRHNISTIIIACHTASAVAVPFLQKNFPEVTFIDMISLCAKHAIHISKTLRIGVMATHSTVSNHAYQTALLKHNPHIHVFEQACPNLASAIEQGRDTTSMLTTYLEPLLNHAIDTLIIGCTHYDLIENKIRANVPNNIQLVLSSQLIPTLFSLIPSSPKNPLITLLSSGDASLLEHKAHAMLPLAPLHYKQK